MDENPSGTKPEPTHLWIGSSKTSDWPGRATELGPEEEVTPWLLGNWLWNDEHLRKAHIPEATSSTLLSFQPKNPTYQYLHIANTTCLAAPLHRLMQQAGSRWIFGYSCSLNHRIHCPTQFICSLCFPVCYMVSPPHETSIGDAA